MKDLSDFMQPANERIYVFLRVVNRQRRANRRRDAELVHDRLRAVLAGADSDALLIAQPLPVKRASATLPSSMRTYTLTRSPHIGL